MKANKYFILFAFTSLALYSCNREVVSETPSGQQELRQLSLVYPDVYTESDTKTEFGAVTYELLWNSGDAIAVYDASTHAFYKYVLDPSCDQKKTGIFNLADGEATPSFGNHDLHAIYPYDAVSVEGSSLFVELYPEIDGGYTYAGAKAGNEAFAKNDILVTTAFKAAALEEDLVPMVKRLVSLMALNVTISDPKIRDERIHKVTFKATGIAGKAEVTFEDGIPVLEVNAGTRNSFSVNLSPYSYFNATDYVVRFIPMLPINTKQSASNMGLTFLLENDNYEVGFHRNRNQNFKSAGNTFLDLYEGFYTNLFNSEEEAGSTNLSWWHVAKTLDISDNATAGAYTNTSLPGSGAGSYADGGELTDE